MDRKIVELLISGKSQNEIMKALQVGKRRIRRLRDDAERAGYLRSDVTLPEYPAALFPEPVDGRTLRTNDNDIRLEPHLGWIKERLQCGWLPITVWEELPVQVARSSFYRFIERHQIARLGESFRHIPEIIHQPGEALLLDWGKLMDVEEGGRRRTLWAFVGVLGFSRYMMVRLVWSNDVATTVTAIESMLSELGGVPKRLTSDNPKCFALEASKFEPILNPVLERMASHYGFTLECLPPADPQKKGKVERPMPYVRRLFQAHSDEWLGLKEAQGYLDKKLSVANERKHGSTRLRPLDELINTELVKLKALPPLAYEPEEFSEASVRQDGFVRFKNKYYSVDENLRGEDVSVVANADRVNIFHKGKLCETHDRIKDPHRTKSIKAHHQKSWEKTLTDHAHYLQRARLLGPDVERMVQQILLEGEGFVDTRKIWGILSLDKSYLPEYINEACREALAIEKIGYRILLSLLKLKPKKKGETSRVAIGSTANTVKSESNIYVRDMREYTEQLTVLH